MSEKNQKFIPLTLGVLVMSVLIGYLVFAWTEPTQIPPQGNVPAPLNVSDTPQTKTESLRLGGLRTDSHTWLATESGNVGIGTTTPAYKLDINGALRLLPSSLPPASNGVIYYESKEIKLNVTHLLAADRV